MAGEQNVLSKAMRGTVMDFSSIGLIWPSRPPAERPGPLTIAAVLDDQLARDPDQLVLVGRHGRYSASELDHAANQAAEAFLRFGIEAGDRVGVSLPNDAEVVVAFRGARRIGAIFVGLNRTLAAPEKHYMLRDCQAKLFLGDPTMVEQIIQARREMPDLGEVLTVEPSAPQEGWLGLRGECSSEPPERVVDPLAPAALAYTSGTTGFPKGAVHTQHNLLLPGAVARWRAGGPTGEILGVPLPLTLLNLMVLGPLVAFQTGGRLVAIDQIDSAGLAGWIEAEGVNTFAAVPAMVHDLLTNPEVGQHQLSSLTAIGVGGASMPDAFRTLYEDRFGRRCGTGYGLTEAPTTVAQEDLEEEPIPGTCGKPLLQVRIEIHDERGDLCAPGSVGEVCIGPALSGPFEDVWRPMLGYWNRPEESAVALRGGILHTGDLGELDEAGHLFIKDRKNDLIIRGGSNVYPAEVERVLHDDARVAACAVVGRPDERLGERVVAFVQLSPDASECAEELRAHCQEQLARYKVPDEFFFVTSFDLTPMGKIRKGDLRDRLA